MGTRSFTLWILIVIIALLLAGLAAGGLVVLPQIQQTQTRQARQAEAEQHYQAGVAFQKTGDWAVRSYNTDDLGVIFVNGKMVGTSTYKAHDNTGWIIINDLLLPGQDTVIAFASSNDGGSERRWGFSVRRNDVALWGSEESPGSGPKTLSYVQQVAIHPDGSVEALPPDTSARTPLPGKWYVRVQDVDDVGAILVNGVPVAAVHDRRDSGWAEITGQLYSDRDNAVTVTAWNFDAGYAWKFSIKRDETILWAVEKSGSGLTGLTLYQPVTISSHGELMAP